MPRSMPHLEQQCESRAGERETKSNCSSATKAPEFPLMNSTASSTSFTVLGKAIRFWQGLALALPSHGGLSRPWAVQSWRRIVQIGQELFSRSPCPHQNQLSWALLHDHAA